MKLNISRPELVVILDGVLKFSQPLKFFTGAKGLGYMITGVSHCALKFSVIAFN